MRNPAIADASPLIVLAKIGQLPLLELAGDPVFVPRAVEQEIHCEFARRDAAL